MPKPTGPWITVTCSSVGCQCGGTLEPAAVLIRMTNGPAFCGLPDSTAISAPGPPGGNGPHLIASGASITCVGRAEPFFASAAWTNETDGMARTTVARTNLRTSIDRTSCELGGRVTAHVARSHRAGG